MRTMRSGVLIVAGALALMLGGAVSLAAQDPTPAPSTPPAYPVTLRYGTGLIDVPVAWVSPNSGEIFLGISALNLPACGDPCGLSTSEKWNTNLTLETHWIKKFTVGFSLYSNNPEWGFYGQYLALTEDPASSWKPSVAVGFRNLGPYTHEERLLIGHDVNVDSGGGTTPVDPNWSKGFHTAPTFYATATKNWAVGKTGWFGATIGFGNGLFSENGGLGNAYNDKGTIVQGLFLGGRYAFKPSENTALDFLLENNGFDWNAGAVFNWRGIFAGLYATEIEEGAKSPSHGAMYTTYNYTKFSLAFGLNTNVFVASKGSTMRARVSELQKQEAQLNAEIAAREQKITQLEEQLRKAQAGELAETAKRREALDAQIQEEKEAIKKAQERLEQLQGGQKPPATPPSGGTPQR